MADWQLLYYVHTTIAGCLLPAWFGCRFMSVHMPFFALLASLFSLPVKLLKCVCAHLSVRPSVKMSHCCRSHKIRVANMSLGGPNSLAVCNAVYFAVRAGITFVVAAGAVSSRSDAGRQLS